MSTPVTTRRFGGASRLLHGIPHVFVIAWAVMVLLPLAWIVMSSLKTNAEIYRNPFGPPGELRLGIYAEAWQISNIGSYFVNTVIVVAGGVVLTLLLSAMAAYVFARYPFFGRRGFYYLYLAGMTFPVFLAIVPLTKIAQTLGLFANKPGLILIYTAFSLPFSVFFLTAFFQSLPGELAEAAFIDGAGHFGVFFRVMLPLARPGLISIGVFNFLGQWNQYLLPVVLNPPVDQARSNFVLTQGLADLALRQNYESGPTAVAQLFAGLVIAMIPVLAVYIVFQRHVQEGLTAGALK
ncbi:MAG TPA: carbohydrate ABC transporter permease [Candidatus Avipropionibacterium avicola]|uniref:Carbohydrate ABC transporter permease n=1 Tax=Candidatus Avipropionibacterium avicola TaxID=2840701 RepID=A0A9D1GZS3_9ACTN|nr:carbohydrate ABC transporter permease [Candidatus Avipropionibacterium avicola]